MNRPSTSPLIEPSFPLQRAQFFVAFISHGSTPHPTPLDRGRFSGDLTDFSCTNWTLCAVKNN